MAHKSVFKEHQDDLEKVAHNVILRAEKFMRDQDKHELADVWIDEMLAPHDEVKNK